MKPRVINWDRLTALCTLILSCATIWLALETRWLAQRWRDASADQVKAWSQTAVDKTGVRTWLALESRFDSPEMKRARRELASQLDPYDPSSHTPINEDVLDLFESIGTVYNNGLLNKKLANSSFSYYATHWWEAAKHYVDEQRKQHSDDQSLFKEFETFAQAMRQPGEKIDAESLKRFLEDEKHPNVN
jgi:hypothetical protein